MPTHPKDLAFVERIMNGDEEAADFFVLKYYGRFERLARRGGIRAEDCQDFSQEVFLTAFSQIHRGLFRGDSSLETWLNKIVRGKLSDYWRARAHNFMKSSPLPATWDMPETSITSDDLLPAIIVDYCAVIAVHEALRWLPGQQRTILILNRGAGFTIEEIGQRMEMTMGQVSNRLYKAEDTFRLLLHREP
jgi:RNA polymerase sigma-70 factor (ECF subfamily)